MPTPESWRNHAETAIRREAPFSGKTLRHAATALSELHVGKPLVAPLDAAYAERNKLVAALIRITGWPACMAPDFDAPGYTVVYVESPAGQLSWHVSDEEIDQFLALGLPWRPWAPGVWDGHTTEEKYERLARLKGG
jgi:hypothetical protein